jgi:hypothetical protein
VAKAVAAIDLAALGLDTANRAASTPDDNPPTNHAALARHAMLGRDGVRFRSVACAEHVEMISFRVRSSGLFLSRPARRTLRIAVPCGVVSCAVGADWSVRRRMLRLIVAGTLSVRSLLLAMRERIAQLSAQTAPARQRAARPAAPPLVPADLDESCAHDAAAWTAWAAQHRVPLGMPPPPPPARVSPPDARPSDAAGARDAEPTGSARSDGRSWIGWFRSSVSPAAAAQPLASERMGSRADECSEEASAEVLWPMEATVRWAARACAAAVAGESMPPAPPVIGGVDGAFCTLAECVCARAWRARAPPLAVWMCLAVLHSASCMLWALVCRRSRK